MTLRIVSRGSRLALWQTHAVRDALLARDPGLRIEVRVVKTAGDRVLDVPLARIGDTGVFTRELDRALLDGEADLAVHSLKDLPTRLPPGLALAAVTAREDPRDVLLLPGAAPGSLATLPPGARVGTSSLRRRAQLAALRPDLEVPDLRGNLDTRLEKLDGGACDAIVLAAAGVLRLGWRDRIAEWLDPDRWTPAVGQGALAVVVPEARPDLIGVVGALGDPATTAATAAERSLLRSLEGGCQVPIGALGTVAGGRLRLRGMVSSLDGTRVLRVERTAGVDAALEVGLEAAEELRASGADTLLAEARAAGVSGASAP